MSEDLYAFTDTGAALPWHEWGPSTVAADIAERIGAPPSAVVGLNLAMSPDGKLTAVVEITAAVVIE